MQFPQFRKYKISETYFHILSEKEFEELNFIGSKYQVRIIEADQYPEMVRIQDMLNCKEEAWVAISSEDYAVALEKAKKDYTLIG